MSKLSAIRWRIFLELVDSARSSRWFTEVNDWFMQLRAAISGRWCCPQKRVWVWIVWKLIDAFLLIMINHWRWFDLEMKDGSSDELSDGLKSKKMWCRLLTDCCWMQGAGSGLMQRRKPLEQSIRSLPQLLDIPFTVKMRTGVYGNQPTAHQLVKQCHQWGVSMVTVHGRSREQRYTKLSDWDYISKCVQAADPMPVFGNGDILSYEDYEAHVATSGVAGSYTFLFTFKFIFTFLFMIVAYIERIIDFCCQLG